MMTIPDLEEVFETSGGVKIVKWAAKLSQRVIKGKNKENKSTNRRIIKIKQKFNKFNLYCYKSQ